MVNVAIAGGTSPTLGRSMVTAILASESHTPYIFSRKTPPTPETKYDVPVIPVDYGSVEGLVAALKTHKIHTVISVLKILEPEQNLEYHANLLDASAAADVKRLILSDWSLANPSWTRVDALQNRLQMSQLCDRSSGVECIMVQVGGFLEYFAQGCGDVDGLQAGLEDGLMADYIDIAKGELIIPCKDVDEQKVPAKVSMTSLWDVGRFMAASLNLPIGSLGKQVGISGALFDFECVRKKLLNMGTSLEDVRYVNFSDCVALASEKDKKFQEKIQAGKFDIVLFKEKMVAQMYACLCGEEAGGGIVTGRTLNELCPEVRTTSIDELLVRAWGASE